MIGGMRSWRRGWNRFYSWLYPQKSSQHLSLYVSNIGHNFPWRTGLNPEKPLRTIGAAVRRTPVFIRHSIDIVVKK